MTERVWLFDLDNTLHDARPQVFPHIHRRMTAYLAEHLRLDEAAANRLRDDYWQRYGATLLGMMRHHATDPQHFLWHTHQFEALDDMLVHEADLAASLQALDGRKLVFTNGPRHYAEAVLDGIGVRQCFAAIYAIEQTGFQPKPDAAAYRRLLAEEGLAAENCVMVEDSRDNLRTAKQLGMQTVLIDNQAADSHPTPPTEWVDLQIKSVRALSLTQNLLRQAP